MERLQAGGRAWLRELLAAAGLPTDEEAVANGAGGEEELATLHGRYEPYLAGLVAALLMPLTGWVPRPGALDDWQTPRDAGAIDRFAPWMRSGRLGGGRAREEQHTPTNAAHTADQVSCMQDAAGKTSGWKMEPH